LRRFILPFLKILVRIGKLRGVVQHSEDQGWRSGPSQAALVVDLQHGKAHRADKDQSTLQNGAS